MRRAAINICAIAASTPGFMVSYGWSHIAGATAASWDLAFAAWFRARESGDARFAEAEAMLREGWRP
jgi:hypothetical protein